MIRLDPDALWPAVAERSRTALACGSLRPFASQHVELPDAGVRFVARVLTGIREKVELGRRQREEGSNPFLPPYEEPLVVGQVSETHVAMLNKFNVVDHHVLLITRHYEEQEAWLTREDFAAAAACLEACDALVFFNGGPRAGSTQPHKHLQVVPLPLAGGGERLPIEAALRADALPFRCAHAAVDDPSPEGLEALYRQLLAALGLGYGPRPAAAYNLLFTRERMLAVPRTRAGWERFPVNGICFAGTVLVRDPGDLATLRELGPMRVLAETVG